MTVSVAIIHPSVGSDGHWIDDFVDPASPYRFRKLGPVGSRASWHKRGATTTVGEWLGHFRQARTALASNADVVVANFPPLILAACVWKVMLRRPTKIIGWSFNFGRGSKSRLAGLAGRIFRQASLLVTHSGAETVAYARAFGLPQEKLRFVPFQHGRLEAAGDPKRFDIVAMGSAGRDYGTLIEAVRDKDLKVLVIAKPDALAGLAVPGNVEVISGISLAECHALAARSRIMALPVGEMTNAAGQVTLVAAMAMGLPIIATRCVGTEDYLTDGADALLVEMGDVPGFSRAIDRLMNDADLRARLGREAYARWEREFSDEAAGINLRCVLDAVVGFGMQHQPEPATVS